MRADLNSLYDLIMLYKSKIDASDLQKMDVLLQYLEIKTSDCLAEKKELNDAYRRDVQFELPELTEESVRLFRAPFKNKVIVNQVAKP